MELHTLFMSSNIRYNINIYTSNLYIQYRGLPHAHIVYRYTTGPDRGNKEDVIKFMDSFSTARFPDPINIDAIDAEKAEYNEYEYADLI